jgi:hypothetical protein
MSALGKDGGQVYLRLITGTAYDTKGSNVKEKKRILSQYCIKVVAHKVQKLIPRTWRKRLQEMREHGHCKYVGPS